MTNVSSYARGPECEILEVTIGQKLAETASRWPDRPALISRPQGIRLSWRELAAEVTRTADGLRGLGLEPGDRVGVWSTNCAEWIYLQLGCAQAGLTQVNVNPAYLSHELGYVLWKSGMKALVLRASDVRTDYRATLERAVEEQKAAGHPLALRHVIYLPDASASDDSWARMLDGGTPGEVPDDARAVVNIQYTSGTTGSPKGVLLTHRNLLNNARILLSSIAVTEQDRLIVPVPLYHCFGSVAGSLGAIATGAAAILPSATFDPLETMRAIHDDRASVIFGVPTMFIAMLHHAEFSTFDFSSLRSGIMAGAPCPVEVMKRVIVDMHCTGMVVGYGQTEASPVITIADIGDSIEQRTATIGRSCPATEVKIVSPEGETVEIGQQGELCTRGYLVMLGYDRDPESTARAVDEEGWLHTGDLATMRPDGCFRITGRLKDMIIRGGENIYPREIEECFHGHPKVADVQVVGLPDAKFGESVAAWIRLKPGESSTEEEMRGYCKQNLAHYKVPQFFRFVDEFPMTVTGKVQKFRIREIEIGERGLEKAAAIETA